MAEVVTIEKVVHVLNTRTRRSDRKLEASLRTSDDGLSNIEKVRRSFWKRMMLFSV
jgi:hypothetical protein